MLRANHLIIITGVSGSGKSTALDALEDMGYFCVDNLPSPLIANFVDFLIDIPEEWARHPADKNSQANKSLHEWRFALLVDCREEASFPDIAKAIERVRSTGTEVSVLFFDCSDEVVLQRFRETRRPHPMLLSRPSLKTVIDAINKEREALRPFRELASRIVDTSGFTPHDLRRVVEAIFRHQTALEVTFVSFGFKYGAPNDSDLLIDVRFLPNPHFVPELKPLTGCDPGVKDFVMQSRDTKDFLNQYLDLLRFLLPRYQTEGKRYLNVAIGCTGGRHRSVVVAEKLAEALRQDGLNVLFRHRDLER